MAVPVAPLIVDDERLAVMPAGNAPRVKVTGELKPFTATMLTVVLKTAPALSGSDVTSVFKVKPGKPTTIRSRFALCETVRPEAVTVSLYWPGVTVADGVKVNVLTPVPGAARVAALKALVTPVGNPAIENVTGPLKPFVSWLTV